MDRQNNRSQTERKPEGQRRDAASSPGRFSRNDKDPRFSDDRQREDIFQTSGLNKYILNDLYERSSI